MLLASTFYPKIGYATERNTWLELEEMDSVKGWIKKWAEFAFGKGTNA